MDDPEKCDLLTPFELHGQWWRAGADESRQVTGCLSYTPEHGLQLQLHDDLPGELPMIFGGVQRDKPIWGNVCGYAGKRLKTSLFKPIQTNRPNDPRADDKPASHTIFFINRAILGAHAIDPRSVVLSAVHFSVSDLESFANTKAVVAIHEKDGVKVDYTPRGRLELTLRDPSLRASFVTLIGSTSSFEARSCAITYREELTLAPGQPLPLGECEEIVWLLTNFFSLCAREPVELRYVRGLSPSGEVIHSLFNPKGRTGRLRWMDWIFTLKDLNVSLEEVLGGWFDLVKKLGFVGPVFFSELRSPSPVQDARFFHFAGCLEAFHREVLQPSVGKFLPRNEYREITRLLFEHLSPTIPPGLEASMRSALSHANDHSLAERLDALFARLEPETRRMLAEEPQRFLAAIKHSRNKLAHVTDETPGETFEGVEYARANLAIRAWIVILMLKECLIPEAFIRERLMRMNYLFWGPFRFDPRP